MDMQVNVIESVRMPKSSLSIKCENKVINGNL